MKKQVLDTNVIIRLLTADEPKQHEKSKMLFHQADTGGVRLVLLDAVLAEMVFVLSSVYSKGRKAITLILLPLLRHAGVETSHPAVLEDALMRYAASKMDFIDCLVAAYAVAEGHEVASFDKDFRKFKDVAWQIPGRPE